MATLEVSGFAGAGTCATGSACSACSSNGFVDCTGDAASTDVLVVDGEPATGVTGAVEPAVVSVAEEDGISNISEEMSAESLADI